MTLQSDIVADSEGNSWYERNRTKLPVRDDPVLALLARNSVPTVDILEIGCADGWRLSELRERYKARCVGVDLSFSAIISGRERDPKLSLHYGNANRMQFLADEAFDLVIFGFCMYLIDRGSLFSVVAEGDRVLRDRGHLVIYDFLCGPSPHSVPYKHDRRLRTFKMDHPKLFLANPAYRLVDFLHSVREQTGAWLMRKDVEAGWPMEQEE